MTPEEIRAGLILRKIKQVEIADALGVSVVAVNRTIKGELVSKRIRCFIATTLGQSVATIWPRQAA